MFNFVIIKHINALPYPLQANGGAALCFDVTTSRCHD
jgi:hypothetical protein